MHSQRGNILFLILLAIILFVALSYAIMGQREQAPASINKEQVDSLAAQIIQTPNLMENAMQRAMMVEGIPDYGFDLSGQGSAVGANSTCTVTACKMFQSRGGGVPNFKLPDWAWEPGASNSDKEVQFWIAQIIGVGTSATELLFRTQPYLRSELCDAINRQTGNPDLVGITNWTADSIGGVSYTNALTSMPAGSGGVGDQETRLKGRRSFCFNGSFYHALIVR